VRANRADYAITTMCRVLGVSTSGYYSWRGRGLSTRATRDVLLTKKISEIHTRSRGTYGVPRIFDEFQEHGVRVGKKRISRLMKQIGIEGVSRRKGVFTTRRDPEKQPAPDLVNRDFSAQAPNQLWVADITHIPTRTGSLYLATVLDVWSRRIVGWSMACHQRTELVLQALNMALVQRKPSNVIHHSDQGCQYTSTAFENRCNIMGVRQSMGAVGDCYDNAMAESFFATLECELLARTSFENPTVAQRETFGFIEGWYNPHRRHSGAGRLSPINFERRSLPQLENRTR